MDGDTKDRLHNSMMLFLAVILASLSFLAVVGYVYKVSNLMLATTTFAVAVGSNSIDLGWLANYIIITIIVGLLVSTIVYFIASYFSSRRRYKRLENTIKILLDQGDGFIVSEDIEGAKSIYHQLQILFPKVPENLKDQSMSDIIDLHRKIVNLYKAKFMVGDVVETPEQFVETQELVQEVPVTQQPVRKVVVTQRPAVSQPVRKVVVTRRQYVAPVTQNPVSENVMQRKSSMDVSTADLDRMVEKKQQFPPLMNESTALGSLPSQNEVVPIERDDEIKVYANQSKQPVKTETEALNQVLASKPHLSKTENKKEDEIDGDTSRVTHQDEVIEVVSP